MKKIYLVYLNGTTESNHYFQKVWMVFSNKQKAHIYCEYKKEKTDEKWLNHLGLKSAEWTIETEIICTDDYTFNLEKIKAKKLQF